LVEIESRDMQYCFRVDHCCPKYRTILLSDMNINNFYIIMLHNYMKLKQMCKSSVKGNKWKSI